jgi:trk system potassium uptake protein TrkH
MFNQQVSRILGLSWIFLGLSMIGSSLWSIYENTPDLNPLLISSWITVFSGILLYYISYSKFIKYKKELTPRDGFAIVSIGWITMAAFSALPLYISNYYNVYNPITISYIDCYFEAI